MNDINNNISFKSRINFVNKETFDNFRHGVYIDFRPNEILTSEDMAMMQRFEVLLGRNIKNLRLDVIKADEFYTDSVRTCAAGGVVNTKTGESAGFHIYHSFDNLKKIKDILGNIFGRVKNPDRALLIGSKNLKCSEFSVPIFGEIESGISANVPNVTVIKEHVFPYSESGIHYSLGKDTWTICSMFRPHNELKPYYVGSKEDLNKCFKTVKIAEGDFLTFEN